MFLVFSFIRFFTAAVPSCIKQTWVPNVICIVYIVVIPIRNLVLRQKIYYLWASEADLEIYVREVWRWTYSVSSSFLFPFFLVPSFFPFFFFFMAEGGSTPRKSTSGNWWVRECPWQNQHSYKKSISSRRVKNWILNCTKEFVPIL